MCQASPNMDRPYPWRCADCGLKEVRPAVVEHRTTMKHENVLHDVIVPDLRVSKCANCGMVLIDEEADARSRATFRE